MTEQTELEDRDFITAEPTADLLTTLLELATEGGGYDGAHHKDEYFEAIVKLLTGDRFEEFKTFYCYGTTTPTEDTEAVYGWIVED